MVLWMSGLVIGLQNRLQRFESARDLKINFIGRLAQLVQSVCLTSRGSAVRIRQRPHRIYFPSMLVKASVFTKHSESRFRILTFFERIKIDRKIASSTRLLITSQEGKRSKMGRAGVDDLRNEIIDFSLYRQYPIKRYKVGTNFESKK